jgi:hypothetical protein
MTERDHGVSVSEQGPGEPRNRRRMKRAAYASGLLASILCLAISALGLAGVLESETRPSGTVIAAASELATSERTSGDCPWSDDDREGPIEISSAPSRGSVHDA